MKRLPRLYEYSQQVYVNYMQTKKRGKREEAWATAYCYVLAPVLFLFVLWVLADAMWNGKRRLYFLSRDGYMMYTVAKYVCERWQLPMECRYLYCSRYSLRGGEYRLLGKRSLDHICLGGMRVTLERMMMRGLLTAEEAAEAGTYMGWEHKMHKLLTYEQVKGMRPLLENNPLFMDKMREHSGEQYPYVTGYLRQEGLMDDVPYAIVDSGWTGTVQRSIHRLLKSAGYKGKVEGYYFGLYEYPKGADSGLYHTWYFAPKGKKWRKAFFCNNLFECVFSSPEAMVKGYCKNKGSYEPVFAAKSNKNRRYAEAGADILLRYAECYTGESEDKFGEADRMERNLRLEMRVAAKLLHSFMGCPSREEAEVFGSYLFDDDVTGEEKRPLARALTRKEIKEERLVRKLFRHAAGKEHKFQSSAWPEASLVLSGAAGGSILSRTALYKILLYFRKDLERIISPGGRVNERRK